MRISASLRFVMIFSIGVLLWISGCTKKSTNPEIKYDLTKLNAIKVATDPTLDGSSSDAVWANAPQLAVSLGDGMETFDCLTCHAHNSSVQVTLKAVYTNSRLTILASWPDQTASFTRSGTWSFESGSWSKPNSDQSEDRINFFWPIGTIGGDDFNTGGCMTKCHTTDKHPQTPGIEDEAYLTSGRADLWHMKAARSLGATSASGSGLTVDQSSHEVTGGNLSMAGWMDDTYVDVWSATNEDGGRYGDAGSSTYSYNRITDNSRPKYIERNPTNFMDAMVLLQSEIDAGQVYGDPTNGVSDDSAAVYWPNYSALQAVVPERILRPPAGSRGDIVQAAAWNNGTWTTEIARSLNTGNDDDVQFQAGLEYTFGVSIMDNGGGTIHKPSAKHILKIIP